MKPSELLRLVWINITQNKFKTIMTSIGIIVGAATIVMVIAIGKGGQEDVADQFKNLNAGAIDISYDGGDKNRGGNQSSDDSSDSGMMMMPSGSGAPSGSSSSGGSGASGGPSGGFTGGGDSSGGGPSGGPGGGNGGDGGGMPGDMAAHIDRYRQSGNMGRISLNIYCKSSHRSSQAPWPDSQAVYFFQHFFFKFSHIRYR